MLLFDEQRAGGSLEEQLNGTHARLNIDQLGLTQIRSLDVNRHHLYAVLAEDRYTEGALHLAHWSLSFSSMAHVHLTYLADMVYRHVLTFKDGVLVGQEDWTWMPGIVHQRGTSFCDVQVDKLGLFLEEDA